MAILAVDEVMLREPRLLVPRQMPVGNVKIDWSHPLAKDLRVCSIDVRTAPCLNLVNGKRELINEYGNNDYWYATTNSKGTFGTVNGAYAQYANTEVQLPDLSAEIAAAGNVCTVAVLTDVIAGGEGASGYLPMFSSALSGSGHYPYTDNKVYWDAFYFGTRYINGVTSKVDTTVAHLIINKVSNGAQAVWQNAVLLGTGSQASNPTWPAANTRGIGGGRAAGGRVNAAYAVWVWLRYIKDAEIVSFACDPYQFLIPA